MEVQAPAVRRLAIAGLAALAVACAPSAAKPLYDERITLTGGEGRAFPLERGTYSLDLSAKGSGVSVEWIGGDRPRVERTASLSETCVLALDGQLQVRNPDREASIPVQIVVRRLSR